MSEWQGTLSKEDAILILEKLTGYDDPHWDCMVEEHYDEDTDTWPSVYHFLAALLRKESQRLPDTRLNLALIPCWLNKPSE